MTARAPITLERDNLDAPGLVRMLRTGAAVCAEGQGLAMRMDISPDNARALARAIERGLAAEAVARDAGRSNREAWALLLQVNRIRCEAEAQLGLVLRACGAILVVHAALPAILWGIGAW
ncbi:MAG TPA: hypothetical protein PKC84_16080 [Paracoccaceae bacterium]|nr:hypothetical protein [Verrucomicrobiota bacterium]HMO73132.1 hypothetical protein [Paracoccaceae bacterium]